MKSVDEKLWDYIDGSCSAEEAKAIAMLIATDNVYGDKYDELLKFNEGFAEVEMDEPSMAFTYNVMETIRTTHAQSPLKAAINKRIILGIAAFFIVSIAVLLIVTIGSVNWSVAGNTSVKMPAQFNTTTINSFFTGPAIKGFLFFDLVIGLFLLDTYLRRKGVVKQH